MSKDKKNHGDDGLKAARSEKVKARYSIQFLFILVVFLLFAGTALVTLSLFALFYFISDVWSVESNSIALVVSLLIACIIIGSAAASIVSIFVLKRLKRIQLGMMEISRGNFSVRVKERDRLGQRTEFGELERTFNQMASDLDGIELFRNDFINNFSHEFKTPIVSIKGFARQLQNPNLTDEQRREYVEIIASESERLSRMSTNILLLTKLENQQIVSEKNTFSLDEQIRSAIILLEDRWSEKNIELDIDDMPSVEYYFNEEMLSHVWINILSNAINFTHENGKISVSLIREYDKIICSRKDNGIGMDEETVKRIFEKFYQGDKSHHSSGNGIGLNIVKRIITLAHGDITVESAPGQGSTFTVILPL